MKETFPKICVIIHDTVFEFEKLEKVAETSFYLDSDNIKWLQLLLIVNIYICKTIIVKTVEYFSTPNVSNSVVAMELTEFLIK